MRFISCITAIRNATSSGEKRVGAAYSPGMSRICTPEIGVLGDRLSKSPEARRLLIPFQFLSKKTLARPLYVGANEMVQTREFVRQQIEAMRSEVFELVCSG